MLLLNIIKSSNNQYCFMYLRSLLRAGASDFGAPPACSRDLPMPKASKLPPTVFKLTHWIVHVYLSSCFGRSDTHYLSDLCKTDVVSPPSYRLIDIL